MAAVALLASCSSGSSQPSSASTSKETFCALLVAFRSSNDSLDTDVTSGDPTATRAAIARLVSQAKALDKRAPDDIEPYVATVSSFIEQLDGLFAGYGYDLNKLSADPAGVEKYAALNDDVVKTALDQLRTYGDIDCAETTPASTSSTNQPATIQPATTQPATPQPAG